MKQKAQRICAKGRLSEINDSRPGVKPIRLHIYEKDVLFSTVSKGIALGFFFPPWSKKLQDSNYWCKIYLMGEMKQGWNTEHRQKEAAAAKGSIEDKESHF